MEKIGSGVAGGVTFQVRERKSVGVGGGGQISERLNRKMLGER